MSQRKVPRAKRKLPEAKRELIRMGQLAVKEARREFRGTAVKTPLLSESQFRNDPKFSMTIGQAVNILRAIKDAPLGREVRDIIRKYRQQLRQPRIQEQYQGSGKYARIGEMAIETEQELATGHLDRVLERNPLTKKEFGIPNGSTILRAFEILRTETPHYAKKRSIAVTELQTLLKAYGVSGSGARFYPKESSVLKKMVGWLRGAQILYIDGSNRRRPVALMKLGSKTKWVPITLKDAPANVIIITGETRGGKLNVMLRTKEGVKFIALSQHEISKIEEIGLTPTQVLERVQKGIMGAKKS